MGWIYVVGAIVATPLWIAAVYELGKLVDPLK